MRRFTQVLACLLFLGAILAGGFGRAAAQPASITFAAGGDHGATGESVASLAALADSGATFYLALGDLNYGLRGTEPAWCALVASHVGSTFPFQLVAGNHDDGTGGAALIDDFAACLPDRLGSTGRYGTEYYFDYGGLLRVILIAPGLTIGGEVYRYVPGNPHYDWLVQRIDEARAAGLPWVVVGMHMVCITIGAKTCEMGADLMDLLIAKRVDLVLQGHDHNYQRSKQLACARANIFVDSCVVDDGTDGYYRRGAGTIFVIAGAFGQGLYAVSPADPEAGYFARWMGLNADPSYGFLRVTASASQLSAEFVAASGTFIDRFAIGSATDFEPLGVHPQAAAQPTARGRIIGGLLGWKGHLYTGYGDINANTGPIAVTSWDPRRAAFGTHWVSGTEAIYNYRPIGGRLYAPALDPRGPADFAVGEPWEDRLHAGAWHAFDMVTLTGTDLWLIGQQESDAVAWRSLDRGTTWAVARRVAVSAAGHVARFYFAGAYRGKLYLHPVDTSGTSPTSLVFDGATWSNGPNLLPVAGATGWRPVVFAGRMVYQTLQPVVDSGAQLLAFDGQQVTFPLATGIYDFTVSGPELYALTVAGAVLRTTDLLSWSPVATAPPGSRSIATLEGRLYVGTADSQLYRLRQPLARVGRLVTGTGRGGGPHVRWFAPTGSATAPGFHAFHPAFTGGVVVASGNLDGVGAAEIVVGAGPGGGPHVRAFRADGSDFGVSFMAYAPGFGGGVRVAVCDVTGDGRAEIVTAPGPGGGPHVRVFTLAGGLYSIAEFFAYGPSFTGGVFVGCGDVDGDGVGEIITGADAGGGPHVRIWRLVGGGAVVERAGFMAYAQGFGGGVRVAALDVDGDGQAEILTGAGPGGGPHVRVLRFLPATGAIEPVADFHAYDPAFTGGVFVGGADLGYPVGAAIVTGAGAGGGPHVRAIGPDLAEAASFFAYDPRFTGGVTVAGTE